MQIDGPDVAFRRLNALSYWLFPFGGLIALRCPGRSPVFDPAKRGMSGSSICSGFSHPEATLSRCRFSYRAGGLPISGRKPLFGYEGMAFATVAITVLSVVVWAHHMNATGGPHSSFFCLNIL